MYAARDDAWTRLRLTLVICVALTTGCGGAARRPVRSTSSADAGVELVIAALRSDDPARAYALLSADLQQQIGYEQFVEQWQRAQAERRERAGDIAAERRATPHMRERARVTLADGSSVYLVREGSAWRLESALLTILRTGQPRETLQMFAQALATHDYDALLRILTERRRDAIGDLLGDLTTSLTRHLDSGADTIEVLDEDRVEMRWEDGDVRYEILLRKEGSEWRVDELRIRSLPSDSGAAD